MNTHNPLFKLKASSFLKTYGGLMLILAATLLLYLKVFNNLFTNWDDDFYVLENPYLKNFSLSSLKHIFTVYYCGNYHPLTMLSLVLDFRLGGLQSWPYHLTNLILHLANVLLVYLFVKRLLLSLLPDVDYRFIVLLTTGLFAIHPFQVESVAWVSERKNLLYTFFFLWSMIVYVNYSETGKYRLYFLSLGLFILSLFSKGTAVTLPLCILVINFLLGRKIFSQKLLVEKLPFFILSLVFGIIAFYAQDSSNALAKGPDSAYTVIDHLSIAAYGWALYLIKLVYPFHLSAFYPYPPKTEALLPLIVYVTGILSIIITLFTLFYLRRNRFLVWGILFILINISVVIQIIPVGGAMMADRYVYLPSIGFFAALAFALYYFMQKNKNWRWAIYAITILYTCILGEITWQRIAVWKDSITLWSDVLQHYPANNNRGYLNRASAYYYEGNYAAALQDYDKLLTIEPTNGGAYIGLGLVKKALKDTTDAVKAFNRAIVLGQKYDGYLNRACVKIDAKEFSGALADLDSAEHFNATRPELYENKGLIFYKTGQYQQAFQNYDRAIQINPNSGNAYFGRGQARQAINDVEGAMKDFTLSLNLLPSYDCFLNRALLRYTGNDYTGALSDLDNASFLNPKGYEACFDKGYIYLNTDNPANAEKVFTAAIAIESNDYEAYLYRGIARLQLGMLDEARTDLQKSITMNPVASAYYFLGLTYAQMGNNSESCVNLRKAVSMGYEGALQVLQKICN